LVDHDGWNAVFMYWYVLVDYGGWNAVIIYWFILMDYEGWNAVFMYSLSLDLCNHAVTEVIYSQIIEWLVIDELWKTWKATCVVQYKLCARRDWEPHRSTEQPVTG
jgi:hypothetical protein